MDASDDRRTPDDAGSERLGMNEPISRRDFINGTLVAGAGVWLGGRGPGSIVETPAVDAGTGYGGLGDYARSDGHTHGGMSVAHPMRDRKFERAIASAVDTGETYDLVAVGGGISGLAAAVFFQKRAGGRCLVLDNHAIFGGEAKRNEFLVDGQTVVAHQGSAMFPVPKAGGYVASVYEMIGMDRGALEYQKWSGPSPEMPLPQTPYGSSRNYGFYFGPKFGTDPGVWVIDPWGKRLEGAPL